MRRNEPFAQVVIPDDDGIASCTLRGIIRDIDLTVEEFIVLLE